MTDLVPVITPAVVVERDERTVRLGDVGIARENLRFNEPDVNKDAGFFGGDTTQADTDAFFSASDTSKPGLYGRVYYNDSDSNCKTATDDTGKTKCVGPTRSEVTWDLKGVGLTYIQMTNWVKLEQLVIGPFTDE